MSDDRPVQSAGVVARPKEGLLYDMHTGKLHALNASAMAIWEACDGDTAVSEIVMAVSELSGGAVDEIALQIEETVMTLRERGLLEA